MCCSETEFSLLVGGRAAFRNESVQNARSIPSFFLKWIGLLKAVHDPWLQRLLINVLLAVNDHYVAADVGGSSPDVWQVPRLLVYCDRERVKNEIIVLGLNRVFSGQLLEVDIENAFVVSLGRFDAIHKDFDSWNPHLLVKSHEAIH